jgi:hypothetical protein
MALKLLAELDDLQKSSIDAGDGSPAAIRDMVARATQDRLRGKITRGQLADVLKAAAALTNTIYAEAASKTADATVKALDPGDIPETDEEATARALAVLAEGRTDVR